MIRHYLTVAVRSILRSRSYTLITVASLTIGLACSAIIVRWVVSDVSYDRFHSKADRIYRIVQNTHPYNAQPEAMTPMPLAPGLKADYPSVVRATRLLLRDSYAVGHGTESFFENGICLAEPDFFAMFSYTWLEGDVNTVFDEKYATVISQRMSRKYFGDESALGKRLRIKDQQEYIVTGVIANVPANAHLQFNFVIPFRLVEESGRLFDNWGDVSYYTYIEVETPGQTEALTAQINECIEGNYPENESTYRLQALTDIHLYSSGLAWDITGHGDIMYVFAFSLLAVFIMVIACLNFVNLTTARSGLRAKDICVRKVVGAGQGSLVRQFLVESMLQAMMASLLAAVIVELWHGPPGHDFASQLGWSETGNGWVLIGTVAVGPVIGLLAGSYPAISMSGLKPVNGLSGLLKSGRRATAFRRALTVVQFTISVALIIGTLTVWNQLDFLMTTKLGLNQENAVYVKINGELRDRHQTLRTELLRLPQVTSVTQSGSLPTLGRIGSTDSFEWEGQKDDEAVLLNVEAVDYGFFETLGIELVDGRFFSEEWASDSTAIILNETAVKAMQLSDPIGKKFGFQAEGEIVGVVKNYNFKSLHREIEPLVFWLRPNMCRYLMVRITADDPAAAIASIERTCRQFTSDFPIESHFLRDDFERLYVAEQRVGTVFRYGAIVAIAISCLGLFGLASHAAQRRTKEIGIRKALGASVSSVFRLLAWESIWLVGVANLIGWPLAYMAMDRWLETFAYRIDVGWRLYTLAGLLALAIALLTVSFLAVKAARANPVEALRHE